jgi:hypothetical protein
MTKPSRLTALAAVILALPGAALANDSTAELAAGGLVMTKTTAIEMRSEDLYISPKAVRVHYRFANVTPKDVTVTVAFPMPDITTNGYDDMISIPTDDPVNILGFRTLVDGRPAPAQVEQKAFKNGVDRTALLKSMGLPLAPHLAGMEVALDRLPKASQAQLLKLEMAVVNDYDQGKGMEHHLAAAWTLKTTYFWSQTFPAGKELAVEHSYTPSVGESAGTMWGSTFAAKSEDYTRSRAHYCVDDSFIAAANRFRKPGEESAALNEARVEYILTTGANWKAPIGDFHMVIDKGEAANLVSFCGEGVRKTGPTTFEVRHAHYVPTRDVAVLILRPLSSQR